MGLQSFVRIGKTRGVWWAVVGLLGVGKGSSSREWDGCHKLAACGLPWLRAFGCGCQNRFGTPFWGAPPVLEPILVVRLGCSLGGNQAFDPWPFPGLGVF